MTLRVLREAADIVDAVPNFNWLQIAQPWQGECAHVCLHATLLSRKIDNGLHCCRCDAVIR